MIHNLIYTHYIVELIGGGDFQICVRRFGRGVPIISYFAYPHSAGVYVPFEVFQHIVEKRLSPEAAMAYLRQNVDLTGV